MNAKETVNAKRFPVVVETKCENIARIYPLKQKNVAKIYEAMQNFDIVKKVFIFGSSVTGKCHIESDLDVCVDIDATDGLKVFDLQKTIGDICDWNCDILIYDKIGSRLKKIIDQEGVKIYEHVA